MCDKFIEDAFVFQIGFLHTKFNRFWLSEHFSFSNFAIFGKYFPAQILCNAKKNDSCFVFLFIFLLCFVKLYLTNETETLQRILVIFLLLHSLSGIRRYSLSLFDGNSICEVGCVQLNVSMSRVRCANKYRNNSKVNVETQISIEFGDFLVISSFVNDFYFCLHLSPDSVTIYFISIFAFVCKTLFQMVGHFATWNKKQT